MPDLFRTVRGLIGSHELSVRYDRRGVPRRIEADRIENAIDDEVTYRITRFGPLPPRR